MNLRDRTDKKKGVNNFRYETKIILKKIEEHPEIYVIGQPNEYYS